MQTAESHGAPDIKLVNEAYRLRSTDRIKSFLAIEKFAEKGSRASLVYIADMFRRGVELDGILERAKHWHTLAKAAHLSNTSYRFGFGFYRHGDYSSAFDAFSWGAEAGYAPSIYRLANMYLLGVHVEKNLEKSRKLLEVAASKGNAVTKKDLAHIYLMRSTGILPKLKGIVIFFSLFYYQIDLIIRKIRRIPLDEKYLH